MSIGSIVEAIDQQLALLLEVRELLGDGTPTAERKNVVRKSAPPAPSKSPVPRKKKPPVAQQQLDFEHPTETSAPQPVKRRSKETLAEKPLPSVDVIAPVAPKKRDKVAAIVPDVPKALTSSIPSGPVVVKADLAAREREARQAKIVSVHTQPQPAPSKSGLDELIEAAAARGGLKLEELRRSTAS